MKITILIALICLTAITALDLIAYDKTQSKIQDLQKQVSALQPQPLTSFRFQ